MRFTKYHGTGNDFIVIDNRQNQWQDFLFQFKPQAVVLSQLPKNNKTYLPENVAVFELCHRYFGIGADGLMLLQPHSTLDFEMVYFNSDGHLSSMCGNGGRCIAHFAASLGISSKHYEQSSHSEENYMEFWAPDGKHAANINKLTCQVSLSMNKVLSIQPYSKHNNSWVLNTGSPHFVTIVDTTTTALNNTESQSDFDAENNIDTENKEDPFVAWAKSIRYHSDFATEGINVNQVTRNSDHSISMRTYERGVENETLSCGTGVTAAAIASYFSSQTSSPNLADNQTQYSGSIDSTNSVTVHTQGGVLSVSFKFDGISTFDEIQLSGPVTAIFDGEK
jgi:diaminopimelate epimerase